MLALVGSAHSLDSRFGFARLYRTEFDNSVDGGGGGFSTLIPLTAAPQRSRLPTTSNAYARSHEGRRLDHCSLLRVRLRYTTLPLLDPVGPARYSPV